MKKVLVLFFIAFYYNIAAQTNLKVINTSSLTVLEGSNIDVSGDFESESTADVVLKSGASIIVNGSKTGKISYRRNLPTDRIFSSFTTRIWSRVIMILMFQLIMDIDESIPT